MNRRGFTILEVVMASALGTMIVLACLGIMGAMSRTNRLTERRFEQISTLERIHVVMDRTFSSLVMADPSISGLQAIANGNTTPETEGEQTTTAGATLRPRLMLEADSTPSLKTALQRAGTSDLATYTPQRLEVVLDRPPLPKDFAMGLDDSVQANQGPAVEPVVQPGPVRGVFELRPDRATNVVSQPTDAAPVQGWTLWWRPLPTDSTGTDPWELALDPTEDSDAVPVATGLARCQWTAFAKRARSSSLSAMQFIDLPAYMEMEVRTLDGMTATWMFEVSWTVGKEVIEDATGTEDETEGDSAGGRRAEELGIGGGGGGGGGGGARTRGGNDAAGGRPGLGGGRGGGGAGSGGMRGGGGGAR
ncbi:MAG: type II secretion system protein J [Phycisphaerales bacterium]